MRGSNRHRALAARVLSDGNDRGRYKDPEEPREPRTHGLNGVALSPQSSWPRNPLVVGKSKGKGHKRPATPLSIAEVWK